MAKKISVEEVDVFMRQLKLVIAGGIVLFLAPLVIYAVYLEQRFESFADSLQPNLPQELVDDELVRRDLQHLAANPVEGQVIYVPAYSHVYHGKGEPHMLTITLSVRNTSVESELVVKSVRYFNTQGKQVKSYLEKPVRLPPLGTTEIVVERDDVAGGSGANFLVEWLADRPVTEPIVEAVMIDTKGQQGVSFVRRGAVISEVGPDRPADDAE